MELVSPIYFNTAGVIHMATTKSYEFTDHTLNVSFTKKIGEITFATPGKVKGTQDIEVAFFTPTLEQANEYHAMQSLIKACVDNAEDINDRIRSMVISYAKRTDEEKEKLIKMDFMNLKGEFMDILRKDTLFRSIEEYNSNQKLKPFSKSFNNFILDRNKYTHGQLYIHRETLEYILEYIEGKVPSFAVVRKEILVSYNNFYKEILKVISAFNLINQEHRTKASD